MDKKFVYDKLATLNLSNLQKNEIFNLLSEVAKNSGSSSGSNSGNTAEPNIIYETDVRMYGLGVIQPKFLEGENLIKTDNLENPFVKLNLMANEDVTWLSVLIPVQYTAFPNFTTGEVTYIDMFTGKYDETYYLDILFRLGISVSIANVGTISLIYIAPLKVTDVEIYVPNIFSLTEREYEIDTPFINNLKMNQFSEIHLVDGNNTNRVVRLNNVLYSGNQNELNTYDTDTITGMYIHSKHIYQVQILMPPAATPTIKITSYELTPTTT